MSATASPATPSPQRRSITTRLVLLFAGATLLTLVLLGTALYSVLAHEFKRHQDDELSIELKTLAFSMERAVNPFRWARVQTRLDALTPNDDSRRFWVLSDDPTYAYGGELPNAAAIRAHEGDFGQWTLLQHNPPLRALSRRIPAAGERPQVWIVVAGDTSSYTHTLDKFLTALVLSTFVALLAVIGVGTWIARVGLAPLRQLSQEASQLRPTTRAQRLGTDKLPAELSDLAHAFNGALDRLEQAYDQLEAFNADVAHELRTPLANLIGGTQVALSRPRSSPEFQEVLQSNLEELERLSSIINDMLFLARVDRGETPLHLQDTRVAQEVEKTVEFFEFVLDDLHSSVHLEGDLDAHARLEPSLLRRALTNLLQNAIEHSSPGAVLRVHIERESQAVWIRVSNPGQAIDERHLPRLFDRFYRADPARHDREGHHGHGLGLAIVKAVATMHGGSVAASSQEGVNTFGFSLASATTAAAAANTIG